MEKKFKKEVWIGVGAILGSIVIFLVASTILSDRMAIMSQGIINGRAVIGKRADLLTNLADIKRTNTEAAAYQQKMNNLLPSREQLLNFPQILGALAAAHSVSFGFVFRGTPTLPEGTSPGVAAFTLDTGGTLEALKFFLNDAEVKGTKFLMAIDSFELSQGGSVYALNIQGRIFFQ